MTKHQFEWMAVLLFVSLTTSDACKYMKFSPMHSFCKRPNPNCKLLDTGVSDRDKDLIVQVHNDYREKIAMGRETAAGGMPTAANMMEMVWDDELAAIAQKHAEQCEFQHDCYDCRRVDRFMVGQNIYIAMSTGTPRKSDWRNMIKSFYDEIAQFEKRYISPFVFGTYGHFSQVAWASSWRVGCGRAMYMKDGWNTRLMVCNYGPAGNMMGAEMYKIGRPCSACPSNTCCGSSCQRSGIQSDYEGLCKVIR